MASDGDDPSGEGEAEPPGGEDPVGSSGGGPDAPAPPSARAKPLVSSLCAGLASEDGEMAEKSGIALCLVARRQPGKVSTIIGRLVERVVEAPKSVPVVRTLATLRTDHGREIRGALITETGYTDARRIYGRIEHADPWELAAVDADVPGEDEEPSFFGRVMQLIELEEEGRNPLDSDVWTRFIQRLPGEGGESASREDIEQAAARQDSRPRSVRRRHRRIERIENSRTFRAIAARSRFDELEVLSPVRTYRFGKVIRARGRVGPDEHALTIRLPDRPEADDFGDLLADRLREWAHLEEENAVTVADWGETPRPWLATAVVERTLASQDRLSVVDAFEHAETLTRALVSLHRQDVVHGGIDPSAVGYPPNTLDGVVEPMLDHLGLAPVYRRFADPGEYLDLRYAAPEYLDGQYGAIDRTTDVYQLGMVLYRALTGTAPFEGDAAAVREAIRTERLAPPSKRNSDLPAGIDGVIAKATAKQKLMRYENATRFHQEVRTVSRDVLG